MQTVFLVWLPGLGALLAGGGVATWLVAKAMSVTHAMRRDNRNDKLLVSTAGMLKEVCGADEFKALPPDLTTRLERQIYEVEAITRKQL